MGVEYALVDKKRGVAFELGKGSWTILQSRPWSRALIKEALMATFGHCCNWEDLEPLGRRIYAFVVASGDVGDVELRNDCTDYDDTPRIIASRYDPESWSAIPEVEC